MMTTTIGARYRRYVARLGVLAVLLSCEVLVRNPLVCLLPNDHALAAREVIRPEDLTDESFISFGESSVTLCA